MLKFIIIPSVQNTASTVIQQPQQRRRRRRPLGRLTIVVIISGLAALTMTLVNVVTVLFFVDRASPGDDVIDAAAAEQRPPLVSSTAAIFSSRDHQSAVQQPERLKRCADLLPPVSNARQPFIEKRKMFKKIAKKRRRRVDLERPTQCDHDTLRVNPSGKENRPGGDEFNSFRGLPSGRLYFYSAYYDDRDTAGMTSVPVVRVMALLSRPVPHLYCRATADGSHVDEFREMETYEMCENHGKQFGGWILSCRLPTTGSERRPPCWIDVTSSSADSNQSVRLPVYRTSAFGHRNHLKHLVGDSSRELAVCVSPLFGNVAAKTVAEFVEMTSLLGADHIVFYRQLKDNDRGGQRRPEDETETSHTVDKILQHYRNSGLVSVINWTLPLNLSPARSPSSHSATATGQRQQSSAMTLVERDDESTFVWYHGQLLAVNDCLYRTMSNAFQHVSFNDLDEFVVPRRRRSKTKTIPGLLADLDSTAAGASPGSPAYCAFSIRSAFFDPMTSLSSDGPETRRDYEIESDVRTASLSGVRNKVIVKPGEIFEVGIHHVSRTSSSPSACTVHHVDPSDAIIHHYRQCSNDYEPSLNCSAQCLDDTLIGSDDVPSTSRLHQLRRRVRRTFDRIS